MDQGNPAKEHPADALADMAAGEDEVEQPAEQAEVPSDPLAALDTLAGEDEADEDAADPSPDAPEIDLTVPVAVAPATGQARRAQAAAAARARHANAHAYKKTMVPFLAVVSVLLVVVGVLTTVLVLDEPGGTPPSNQRLFKIFLMLVSYPLSAILAFGAWWFHRDTRR